MVAKFRVQVPDWVESAVTSNVPVVVVRTRELGEKVQLFAVP